MTRRKLVITQRTGNGGTCSEEITATRYTPSKDAKGLSSLFVMPPSEDPWSKDFPDRITRTFHFSMSGGGEASTSSTPASSPPFVRSSVRASTSGAPQGRFVKGSTLDKFGNKSSVLDSSPKVGNTPTTAKTSRGVVSSPGTERITQKTPKIASPGTERVAKKTPNASPTTRASVRAKRKPATTAPHNTIIIQQLEGSPKTRKGKPDQVTLTPETKAKSQITKPQSTNNNKNQSGLALTRVVNKDDKHAPKVRHSARFFRPKITPKARSSMRVSGKHGGETSARTVTDTVASESGNEKVDEDKPGRFFKRKSSGGFSGFWSFRRGSNAPSSSTKPADEDGPRSPTQRKSSGGLSSWFRGGNNATSDPDTDDKDSNAFKNRRKSSSGFSNFFSFRRKSNASVIDDATHDTEAKDTGEKDNNTFSNRRKSSSGFSNFFSFRRKSNASVIDDDKSSIRRVSVGRFSLRKGSVTAQDDDLGHRSAFVRSSMGFGGRWGRRKSSGTPFIVKSETKDRMGKKTTTVETRTYFKDGKNFEETIETITTENDGKITTKKTISTREVDAFDTKALGKSLEKGHKGLKKAQNSSSSSDSPSPDLHKVKEKEGSRKLFKSKGGSKAQAASSGDSSDEEDFVEEVVKTVNEHRKKHGVGKLKLNKEVSKKALEVAQKLGKMDKLEHSDDKTYGENLFCMFSSNPKFHMSGKQVVDSWYSEIKKHEFGREPEGVLLKSGHFTQLVWKDTKEIGVAKARNVTGHKIYVVAKFSPKGNWLGHFATQVPPVGGFPKQSTVGKIFSRKKDSSGDSSSDEEDFNGDCLKAHNVYRKKHGVAPVKLNKDLNKFAKSWAHKIAKQDRTEHRPNNDYGENIYGMWSSNPRHRIKGSEAVDAWYDEVNNYDFSEEPDSMEAGHFTQLVWKDSKEIGVGKARAKNGKIYVVVNYNPPGNIVGMFIDQVPPPK